MLKKLVVLLSISTLLLTGISFAGEEDIPIVMQQSNPTTTPSATTIVLNVN